MKRLLSLLVVLGLSGCISTPETSHTLELFFSQEQLTLTSQQTRQLTQYFQSHSSTTVTADIAPASIDNKFQALLRGKQRLSAVKQIANGHQVTLLQNYNPTLQMDTLVLGSQ